ncbi:MAG TPA: hypothetical protein VIY54_00795 [Steroidobacteraceae bacterium]
MGEMLIGVLEITTLTVAAALIPPEPLQLSEYVAEALSAPVLAVPLGGSVPLHDPEAVHVVAPVALHFSVELEPLASTVG